MERWNWFKEKFAEGLVSTLIMGILAVAGFGLVEAYLSDYRRDKLRDEMSQKMLDQHNDGVKREGEILERLAKLEQICKLQSDALASFRTRLASSLTVPPPPPPPLSTTPPDPLEEWRKLPRLDPSQQRLDWQDKNQRKYFDVQKK